MKGAMQIADIGAGIMMTDKPTKFLTMGQRAKDERPNALPSEFHAIHCDRNIVHHIIIVSSNMNDGVGEILG